MKRVLSLLLVFVMIMSIAACSGNGNNVNVTSQPTTGSNTKEVPVETTKAASEPKILRLAEIGAASSASTLVSTQSTDSTIQMYIHAHLYSYLPVGNKAVLKPDLAASEPVDVNGDGKTWNISIDPNAKWDNGDPINADTFIYTFKMALDPKLLFPKGLTVGKNLITIANAEAYYTQASTGVSVSWEDVGIKKIDDLTIQITITNVVSSYIVMQHFSNSATVPVYEPLFEQCLSSDRTTTTYGSTADKIACSGPFKLTKWQVGALREYIKNENYLHADLINFDGINQRVVEDNNTALQLFETGETDYTPLDANAMKKYGDDPRVMTIPSRYVRHIEYCFTNTENPIIGNENFRLALYYATNRTAIAKLSGDKPGTGVLQLPVAKSDGTTFRELADKAGYLPKGDAYDPELARKYFDKALEEEGLDKVKVSIIYNNSVADYDYIVEYIQEDWANIFGTNRFELVLDGRPSAQASEQIKSCLTNPNAYELCLTSWTIADGDYDPVAAMVVFTTSKSNRNAPYNDPVLESLFAEANNGGNRLNMDKRNELAMEMEKHIIEHGMVNPILYDVSYGMISDRVILALDGFDISMGFGWTFADIAE